MKFRVLLVFLMSFCIRSWSSFWTFTVVIEVQYAVWICLSWFTRYSSCLKNLLICKKLFTYMCQCILTFKCCPGCINIDFDRQILENFNYRDFTFPYCKLQRYLNYSCKATLTDVHKLLCNVLPNLAYITSTVSGKLTYWQQKVSVWH